MAKAKDVDGQRGVSACHRKVWNCCDGVMSWLSPRAPTVDFGSSGWAASGSSRSGSRGPRLPPRSATSTRGRGPVQPIAWPCRRDKPEFGTLVFHGATVDHVAAPTRPIEGTVRDKDTGRPLAGVSIRSDRFAGSVINGRVRTSGRPLAQMAGTVWSACPAGLGT